MKALDKPLTIEEIKKQYSETADVEGVIRIHFDEIVDVCCTRGLEGFLDILSERLTRSCLLMDVDYEIVDVENGYLSVRVGGDPSMIIDFEED